MKKTLALLLALACLLGLTACGSEKLEEPPELRIVSADGAVTASKGSYSWMYDMAFGGSTGVDSDSIHPLDYEDLVDTLTTDGAAVKLEFDVEPDSITAAECWSDEHWGSDYTTPGESFRLEGDQVYLNCGGGWVYVISARWDRDNYEGTCRYVFHVVQTSTTITITC